MNPSVIFLCLVLAFVAFTETNAVRGGWASGATQDRDPKNPNYKSAGQQKYPYVYKAEGQNADAKANGDNPNVYTYTMKKGANKVSIASASGTKDVYSSASAK